LLYLTFAAIAMLTSAVQLTPFAPIDTYLISLDKALHINLVKLMAWTAKYPIFRDLLARTYDSLPWQMAILPIVLAVFGQFTKLKEYYCLLLISAIIGFSFYYFFPTTAPATNLSSPYFIKEQYDTGLKFKEIHHHISPTTVEGGMIALPSFHVIWAWLCLYLARCWLPLVIVLAPLNVLLILSCVLLGWHYFVDVLGAVFVLFLSHLIYEYSNNKKESALCLECSSHN
jgi:membrane-associated phospholipid phosphatase